ncbi:TauD/TfdA dioxygenase family protein [Variovorax sp. VNK109]|uniref:TauD/TfdA dioxygenase family protein n=1 Tax=Variovorax sp. VNK109 TaxID=3400919 RepID=UPI003C03FE84
MNMKINDINPGFGAEISGIDLSKPLDPDVVERIKNAVQEKVVVVFHGQQLDSAQQVAFSQLFGPPELPWRHMRGEMNGLVEHSAISMIGNVDEQGQIISKDDRRRLNQRGNMLWHTDSSYRHPSGLFTFLYGCHIPKMGGGTQFADTRAAYDALPEATKQRIDGLRVEHNLDRTFAEAGSPRLTDSEKRILPPVGHSLVRVHPSTGRKALYLGSPASRIAGWSVEDSRKLLDELTTHSTQRQFILTHRWSPDDLVMWDNRSSLHRGEAFNEGEFKRQLRRITVSDLDTIPA